MTPSLLRQLANQAGPAGIAIPENAFAVDVEAVRFGIALRQLNLRQNRSIPRIKLVDGAVVGVDDPEQSLVPGDAMRSRCRARAWNASEDFAGLRLHQMHP